MGTTNAEAIAEFIRSRGSSNVVNKNKTIFSDEGVLYSYGRRYPLARFSGGNIYINSTPYSPTTAQHRGLVRGAAVKAGINVVQTKDIFFTPDDEDRLAKSSEAVLEDWRGNPTRYGWWFSDPERHEVFRYLCKVRGHDLTIARDVWDIQVVRATNANTMSISLAKEFYPRLMKIRKSGRKRGSIGGYQISLDDKAATVTIGCTKIAWASIDRIAKELGIDANEKAETA